MATTPANLPLLVRLADWSYRRRRRVLVGWIFLLFLTISLAASYAGENDFTFTTPGSESERAQQLLDRGFPARAGDDVQAVFKADAGVNDAAARAAIQSALDKLATAPHVSAIDSPLDPAFAQRQVSPDGKIAFAVLRLDVGISDYKIEDSQALVGMRKSVEAPGLQVEMGGFALQGAEQSEFSSEGLGLLVAIFILLVSFGSVLAMGLPVMIAVMGLGIGLSLVGLLANVLEVPDFAPQIAAMIGIGVGIDYVLFIVTRYRSALNDGLEPRAAVITAMTTSGRAVIFAGCTVIISLLGLFVMNLGFLRGLAVGAVAAVLVVMLAAVTLLPAMLGYVGRTLDRLRVPFVGRMQAGDRKSLSYRWSRVVQRRPWPAAIICFVGLAALAGQALTMHFGFPDAGTSPEQFTTRRAYDLLSEGFGPGFNGPLVLVAHDKTGGDVRAAAGAMREKLAGTDGVAFMSPAIPSPDGKVALFITYPKSAPQAQETEDLVHRFRNDAIPAATAGGPVEVFVGGSTGASVDATRYVADRLPLFIGAVIVLSFLLLLVVFRSVLVPLKAAIMNLLSVGAAYGVVAIMVRGGWLGGLLGIHDPVPVPSFIPMMMFAILFGLSMDYEVFLLSRIREEYTKTRDNAGAVADGLANTARVITAAAAIMISVFLAFVLADEVFLKMIGIGLATAILVDATIVRMVLVPATMELLGDANWWLPDWLAKRLPRLHVEGESAEDIERELQELVDREEAKAARSGR